MKKLFGIAWAVISLFSWLNTVALPLTAQGHVETYPEGSVSTSKTPDLRRTVIALNFHGDLENEVKSALLIKDAKHKQNGARRFVVDGGENPCLVPGQAVVCFSFGEPQQIPFSGSGTDSAYSNGGRGGNYSTYSESVAQQGNEYGVTVYAVLIDANGNETELGFASSSVFAGVTTSSMTNSGVYLSGSSNMTSMKTSDEAIAEAEKRALMGLINGGGFWRGFGRMIAVNGMHGRTEVHWLPTSASSINQAFGK